MRNETLGDIAVRMPQAIDVFEKYHLDFCCRGHRTLDDACAEDGLNVDEVGAAILAAAPRREEWQEGSVSDLIDHLLVNYHRPLDTDLPRLSKLGEKVARVHGDNHPFLKDVYRTYEGLRMDLVQHMQKEEQILFPMLRSGQGAMAGGPITVMRMEHDEAGAFLTRLRTLCSDYEPPPEACGSWRALYSGLAQLEADLHRHIHLENNVLFAEE